MEPRAYPPAGLANRVGRTVEVDGSFARYDAVGGATRDALLSVLPDGWSWDGKRVLDFGCGAGRTLRHLVDDAPGAELWGCDIDAESVAWVNANLAPARAFVNAEWPPIDRPAASFHLVYAFSVFTHITDAWSAWLVELHRLLAPDGLLVASFLGAGMAEQLTGEPWDGDRIGMNVLLAHQGWERGGPTVLLSPWWIRAHWGRQFEIVELRDQEGSGSHGLVVARPRPEACDPSELERIDAAEPRELAALRHQVQQLQRESAAASEQLAEAVAFFEGSRSWRLTRPLRAAARRVRARDGGTGP